ncbi:MAG: EXORDIUM family protein, partial [Acidobacteriota bacterium]|nr:EXORDIUM family protein [Acidobacteriota bacterium]
GINYNGGPVMNGAVNIYFIWYGDWTQDANANGILTYWAQHIGGSPYMGVNTTYGDTTGSVSGQVSYVTSTADTGSLGTSLSDSSIGTLVSNALRSNSLPTDSNGVYFVLTAPGVKETSGFLTHYCGWHTYGNINGANIKYAFVGDAAGPSFGSCAVQSSSPNGDAAADAMASVMSHELEESISDPNLNAWYDASGNENADLCAWTFGAATYAAAGGGVANMKLGTQDFLIQQNWLNANGGGCALSYTATPDFSLSVSPNPQSLPSTGGTANYSIAVTPIGGFNGTVTYSRPALPSGITGGINGTTLSLTTTSATAPATYPITITGTSGSTVRTTTATLVVNPPPQPTFSLSVSPSSATVHRPGTASFTVTLGSQNGFTGTVALSVSGAKTGVTLALSPTSVTGNGSSTLTATVSGSAKRGNTTLTVTGTSGTISKTAAASLQIQ